MCRLLPLLFALTAASLSGCGNQGALTLPITRPPAVHPVAPASPTSVARHSDSQL